jgi:hypothetical protein
MSFLLYKTAEMNQAALLKVVALAFAFSAAHCVASPVAAVHP